MKPALQEHYRILKKPPETRTEEDLQEIASVVGMVPFFQKLGPNVQAQCCRALKYQYIKAGEVIFEEGDPGSLFYVVLEGSVGIFVRDATVDEQKQGKRAAEVRDAYEERKAAQQETLRQDMLKRLSKRVSTASNARLVNRVRRAQFAVGTCDQDSESDAGCMSSTSSDNSSSTSSDSSSTSSESTRRNNHRSSNNRRSFDVEGEARNEIGSNNSGTDNANSRSSSRSSRCSISSSSVRRRSSTDDNSCKSSRASSKTSHRSCGSKSSSSSGDTARECEEDDADNEEDCGSAASNRQSTSSSSTASSTEPVPPPVARLTRRRVTFIDLSVASRSVRTSIPQLPAPPKSRGSSFTSTGSRNSRRSGSLLAARLQQMKQVATLHAGATFGEIALQSDTPRTATVQALLHTCAGVLERADYQRILAGTYQQEYQQRVNLLKRVPLFSEWEEKRILRLTNMLHRRNLRKNDLVYDVGSVALQVFFIFSGEFAVRRCAGAQPFGCSDPAKPDSSETPKDSGRATPQDMVSEAVGTLSTLRRRSSVAVILCPEELRSQLLKKVGGGGAGDPMSRRASTAPAGESSRSAPSQLPSNLFWCTVALATSPQLLGLHDYIIGLRAHSERVVCQSATGCVYGILARNLVSQFDRQTRARMIEGSRAHDRFMQTRMHLQWQIALNTPSALANLPAEVQRGLPRIGLTTKRKGCSGHYVPAQQASVAGDVYSVEGRMLAINAAADATSQTLAPMFTLTSASAKAELLEASISSPCVLVARRPSFFSNNPSIANGETNGEANLLRTSRDDDYGTDKIESPVSKRRVNLKWLEELARHRSGIPNCPPARCPTMTSARISKLPQHLSSEPPCSETKEIWKRTKSIRAVLHSSEQPSPCARSSCVQPSVQPNRDPPLRSDASNKVVLGATAKAKAAGKCGRVPQTAPPSHGDPAACQDEAPTVQIKAVPGATGPKSGDGEEPELPRLLGRQNFYGQAKKYNPTEDKYKDCPEPQIQRTAGSRPLDTITTSASAPRATFVDVMYPKLAGFFSRRAWATAGFGNVTSENDACQDARVAKVSKNPYVKSQAVPDPALVPVDLSQVYRMPPSSRQRHRR